MDQTLHITSGDASGEILAASGIQGEVFVWHDVLYDGPRKPGWPSEEILQDRARFLEIFSGGGLSFEGILTTLKRQYAKLSTADTFDSVVLWFDACLFDQSMLAHVLTCLQLNEINGVSLICVDAWPGIDRFNGLGQLKPEDLASLVGSGQPVTEVQYIYAAEVDRAFALNDPQLLSELSGQTDAPLPWVPAAAARWLKEQPDSETGLRHLETLALAAIRSGVEKPVDIFRAVAAAETPPQYWGDTTLWARINDLAGHTPPLVTVDGPTSRLPQWNPVDLDDFRVRPVRGA
ncbi:MAG: hypothetical protein DRP71_17220 [Verrucomicrobia bacterium]|nr:MAG: hypothetical protein DRP71_17220 [Verrucomicrobiota bacterium]